MKTRYHLPCAAPESSGDDQIKSDFFKVLADGEKEERRETSPAERHGDMSGNHQEQREILLARVQALGGNDKVVAKLECPTSVTELEGPGQLHLEMQQTAVNSFSLADGRRSSE